MSCKISAHIGQKMSSSAEEGGYESSEVVNCNAFNEALNNSLNTERSRIMQDILICGFSVVEMVSDLPSESYQDGGITRFPVMLDIGPSIKSLIVAGRLTDVMGSKTRENKSSKDGNPANGSSRFLPASFPPWMNDAILMTIPNYESVKSMVNDGVMKAKVFEIDPLTRGNRDDGDEDDDENKIIGTLDQVVDADSSATASAAGGGTKGKRRKKKNKKNSSRNGKPVAVTPANINRASSQHDEQVLLFGGDQESTLAAGAGIAVETAEAADLTSLTSPFHGIHRVLEERGIDVGSQQQQQQ